MAATTGLATGLCRGRNLRRRGRPGRLTDGVSEGEQIVAGGFAGARIGSQADDLPAPGSREAFAVLRTQVIGVGFGEGGEGTQHGRLVGVHVGERVDRRAATCGARTTTGGSHEATVPRLRRTPD